MMVESSSSSLSGIHLMEISRNNKKVEEKKKRQRRRKVTKPWPKMPKGGLRVEREKMEEIVYSL